jgi:hypothetical protein
MIFSGSSDMESNINFFDIYNFNNFSDDISLAYFWDLEFNIDFANKIFSDNYFGLTNFFSITLPNESFIIITVNTFNNEELINLLLDFYEKRPKLLKIKNKQLKRMFEISGGVMENMKLLVDNNQTIFEFKYVFKHFTIKTINETETE